MSLNNNPPAPPQSWLSPIWCSSRSCVRGKRAGGPDSGFNSLLLYFLCSLLSLTPPNSPGTPPRLKGWIRAHRGQKPNLQCLFDSKPSTTPWACDSPAFICLWNSCRCGNLRNNSQWGPAKNAPNEPFKNTLGLHILSEHVEQSYHLKV